MCVTRIQTENPEVPYGGGSASRAHSNTQDMRRSCLLSGIIDQFGGQSCPLATSAVPYKPGDGVQKQEYSRGALATLPVPCLEFHAEPQP